VILFWYPPVAVGFNHLFALRLQPELDEAAGGFRTSRLAVLQRSPSVDRGHEIRLRVDAMSVPLPVVARALLCYHDLAFHRTRVYKKVSRRGSGHFRPRSNPSKRKGRKPWPGLNACLARHPKARL